MLSERYFTIFRYQLKMAYWLSGTPFKFCQEERRIFTTKFGHAKYAFHIALLVIYGLFLFIQLIRHHRMGLTTDFYYYFLYALTVCGVFDTIAAYPFLRQPELAAAFMTEFWRFLDEIQSDFMPTFDPNHSCANKFFDFTINIWGITCPFIGLLISCHYLFFPTWPCYLSSLVPPEDLTLTVRLISGIIYFYGLQMIWAVLLITSVSLLTYGSYVFLIAHEYFCFADDVRGPPGLMAKRVWHRQKTEKAFRSFEEYPSRYRQFQILHLNFEEVFAPVIMPLQATITNLGVFCNFSLIKYKAMLTLTNTAILCIWSFGATACCLIGLSFCGTMYTKSSRALRTVKNKDWGSKYKNLYMSKFVRSCTPISYGYGRMYVIRMLSVFKFIKHMTRGTFRALLTLT